MPEAYKTSETQSLRKFAPAFMLALLASSGSLLAVTYDSNRQVDRAFVSIPAPSFDPGLGENDGVASDGATIDHTLTEAGKFGGLNTTSESGTLATTEAPDPISGQNVAMLRSAMDKVGFDLEAVRSGNARVPRVLADAIPYDLASVSHTPDKKRDFIRMMLPMILATNEAVAQDRAQVIALQKQILAGEDVPVERQAWLEDQFAEYNADSGDFETLLTRLDTIPPSLVLAQAAIESGWGSSRFAREGNALFGQWTTAEHRGIVPAARDEGKTHKIRAFDTPAESVESYFRNLNTHRAYKALRAVRAKGPGADSMRLADTLIAYSEKGQDYVDLLKSVIRINALKDFDGAKLAPTTPTVFDTNA